MTKERSLEERTKETGGYHLAEFYRQVADVMQEEKTTLRSLQTSIDTIIIDQGVSMHLYQPGNGQYVRREKGVYHGQGLGCVSTWLLYTLSFSVL